MSLLVFLDIILFIITLALLLFAITQFFNVLVRGLPPFLPTQDKIILRAGENLQLNSQDVVYELGCGRAKFLRSLVKKFPEAEYIGIEYSFLPYLLSRFQLLFTPGHIKIIKHNFFTVDLRRATLLYFYLLPETMERLSAKIKKECRPDTKVISYQFSLPDLVLDKIVIDQNRRLYFYRT